MQRISYFNKRRSQRIKAYWKNDNLIISGSLFFTGLIFILLVLFTGMALGTFFYKLVDNEAQANLQRIAYLKADTCGMPDAPKKVKSVLATAYSSEPGQTDNSPCITATGYDVCENYALYGSSNTIASNFLPVNTLIKIPELFGDKVFVVRDRMNARYGYNNIDIWMPSTGSAKQFGIKQVTIEIY